MRRAGGAGLGLGLLALALAASPVSADPVGEVKKEFRDAKVCGGCHGIVYDEWNGSLHSLATKDPIYVRAAKLFLPAAKKPGELAESGSCLKCHAPVALVAGKTKGVSGKISSSKGLREQGVSCDFYFCHSVRVALGIGDERYGIAPGAEGGEPGIRFGPYRDSESPFHGTSFSALHRSAELCGMCHDVSHVSNLLPIGRTYSEWVKSPYNTGDPSTAVTCQDCHMRQHPGKPSTGMTERPSRPGKAAIMGPEREHAPTHVFIGGNAAVPGLLGFKDHAEMAVERLQNAAGLELSGRGAAAGTVAHVSVRVWNEGAGHYLPTGLTEVRQMWIHLEVRDSSGGSIFASGEPNTSGDLPDGARVFHTILGTPEGKPTMNVALADRVLFDKRVPPKGYVEEKFSFLVPEGAALPLVAKARLRYRTASQRVARLLFEHEAPALPITDMAVAELRIE